MDPTERLTDLPGWSREGEAITKTYKLRDFTSAMAFVNDVADIAVGLSTQTGPTLTEVSGPTW